MDKTKKKNVRRYILWGVLAVVVAGLAMLPALARQQDAQDGPVASVLEATVKEGSVQATVRGGGTLEAGDGEDIELPPEVKITEFLVKNGQEVKKGDPVAKIDKVSALTAVTEIRTSMAAVEKQMETFSDEKSASTVTAPAGGRVKAIYANPGDSVTQVLVEHGALALLSLDGRMSVTLTVSSQLIPGDSIPVTLDSGKTVTGRVESNLNGELTVTIADNGYAVGDTVTLEGLGSGSLEIHNPWLATAFNGTVSQVNIRLEQTVSSGGSLFTLKDTDYTAQRELLAETHRDYEELLQKLLTWQDTGVITAPCDGLVSGIDTDSTHLLAAEDEELTASLLNADDGDFRLVLLSQVTQTCTGDDKCPLKGKDSGHQDGCPKACKHAASEGVCTASEHFDDCIMACTRAENPEDCPATGAHHTDCIKACIETSQEGKCPATKYHYDGCIEKCTESALSGQCPAHIHKKGCIESCISADTLGKCTAGHHKADCIENCIISKSADDPCPATKHKDGCYFQNATYTGQVFKVVSVGSGVLVGYWDSTVYDVVKTASGWARKDGQPFSTNNCVQADTISASGNYQAGDVLLSVTVHKSGENDSPLGLVKISSGGSQKPGFDLSGLMGMMGGFSMGGYGSTGSSQTQLYSLDGDVLLTVTPLDTMTVTIAVDEKDIAGVKTGMTAQLTMNALPDETFEGQVTRVAQTGSGNGGSSKFEVEITLSRESDMLPGMSATAQLTLYEKMDVLTLPVAALRDEGGKTLVYTGKDKKTGEPANPVEVTTGLSDGENVEILSGIDSGTTVYYSYYDTVTESDAVETERSMF
jgi:efflux transporter, RND family, MFP subunit